MKETELYQPVKDFLVALGYDVKAEVKGCDLIAHKEGEEPIIVELKTSFNMALLLQGIDRLGLSDRVYVAFPMGTGKRWKNQRRDGVKLCRRLGLGMLSVRLETGLVQVHCEPEPYTPRKSKKKMSRIMDEFKRREGDPNTGGQVGRMIVTAYRQDAQRLACVLAKGEVTKLKELREMTGIAKAGNILRDNHYGWFYRVARGEYMLSDAGMAAVEEFKV